MNKDYDLITPEQMLQGMQKSLQRIEKKLDKCRTSVLQYTQEKMKLLEEIEDMEQSMKNQKPNLPGL